MRSVLEKGRVTAGQEVLVRLTNHLSMVGTPPLGPEFKKLSGSALDDALVIHRLTAKFEVPKDGARDAIKSASIQKMLEYDKTYPEVAAKLFKGKGSVTRFLKAKAWLHTTLKDCKTRNRVQFPSGESVNTSEGYVDLYYKLTSQEQWTVSSSCVKQAATLAYVNHALKRVVKQRFNCRPFPRGRDPRPQWVEEARTARKSIGFYVFERMFLSLVDIVGYSRITTVPKNNKEDRVITCDPTWNLIVQRSIALDLLECVYNVRGIDVHRLQDLHRGLIAHRKFATVDLSKASDSNWVNIFMMLFPKKIVDRVMSARTGLAYDGENYHKLNQLAPMGCGFTFEIMTLTLLAYARTFDDGATVFGDDIIINAKYATGLNKFLQGMGWKINVEKTFIDGNFSESCGGFFNHTTNSHVVSHDLFYPENFGDIIAAANKLANILLANQVSNYVRKILLVGYVELLKIIPNVVHSVSRVPEGSEASVVYNPIGHESFKGTWTEDHPESGYQRGNLRGKRVVFKTDVELDRVSNDIGLVLYACYLYHGLKAIGPRTGKLVYETYLRYS